MEMLVVIGGTVLALAFAIVVIAVRAIRRRAHTESRVNLEGQAVGGGLVVGRETTPPPEQTRQADEVQKDLITKREAQRQADEARRRAEALTVEQEAQRRAEAERQAVEARARLAAELDEQQRHAEALAIEQEVQRRTEAERQEAEAQARLAAEREAQQRETDEARRRAEALAIEEEAQRRAEAERQESLAQARLAAEREARRESEEARLRAEEEARRAIDPEEQHQADQENRNAPEEIWTGQADDGDRDADPAPADERAPEIPASSAKSRPRQPAVHRDRRGSRRASPAAIALSEAASTSPAPATRLAVEAKLRLSLHPIRRTARISIVLTRPDGFPERVTLQDGVEHALEAYDMRRYDDLDLPWTGELLDGELRLVSTDGFRWIRGARRVHIFAADPNEPDLISVGAARPGVAHALVCRSGDAAEVRSAAASVGSADLQGHEHWQGIPDGWIVLSGYTPAHTAEPPLPNDLLSLDPGAGLEIVLEGGLAIRSRVYAEGHPPRILMSPAGSASITIGGQPATLTANGAWEAPGWDAPGQHIVDVVPGPSASYEIAIDPWATTSWDFWNAHSGRFENQPPRPWTRAEICGAQIRGPAGEKVFAAATQPTLTALGLKSGATQLQRRSDVSVSIGLMAEAPAFLLAATGQRRNQGQVFWLGLAPASQGSGPLDPDWVVAVSSAASRRLPLQCSDALGEDAWRRAKERARRLKRLRS